MKILSNQSWLAWVLISVQMTFGAFGYGRVIVCNDQDGPSHIELVHGESLSHANENGSVAKGCGQVTSPNAIVVSTHCSGTSCDDQVLSFAYTIITPRKIGCGSLMDIVPTGPPAIYDWPSLEPIAIAWVPCDDLDDASVLLGLRRSVRSTVLNL